MPGFKPYGTKSDNQKQTTNNPLNSGSLADDVKRQLESVRYFYSKAEYAECVSRLHLFLSLESLPLDFKIAGNDLLAECLLKTNQTDEALSLLRPLVEQFPDNHNYKVKLASAYRVSGKPQEAIGLLKELTSLFPENGSLAYNYANALRDGKDYEMALGAYQRAEALGCRTADLYTNFIPLLAKLEYNYEAKEAIKRSEAAHGNIFIYNTSVASVLYKFGLFREAYEAINRTLSELGNGPAITAHYLAYAQVHEGIGDLVSSRLYINQGLERLPCHPELMLFSANLYQTSGDIDEAISEYEKIIKQGDCTLETQTETYRRLTVCKKNYGRVKEMSQLLDEAISAKDLESQKNILYAIAKAQEDQRDYHSSFINLRKANELMKNQRNISFDLKQWMQHAHNLLELDRYMLKRGLKIQDTTRGSNLIFIVGMPRSGSTLTESILSITPNAVDLGETVAFPELIGEFQHDLHETDALNSRLLEEIGTKYLKNIGAVTAGNAIYTDKNLYNWRYAGLISLCFPGAKIIHSLRNPVDNMLSIFKAHFPVGNEYAFDLDEIFKVYQLHYQAMKYYRSRHPNSILVSEYDSLVSDPTGYIPKLISEIGLPWNEMYLRPDLNKRSVKTASNIQVRSPINAKSVGGWKKYEEFLAPYHRRFVELGYIV